jgi:hypothetical protein
MVTRSYSVVYVTAQDGGGCHAPDTYCFFLRGNLSFHCAFRATPVNMMLALTWWRDTFRQLRLLYTSYPPASCTNKIVSCSRRHICFTNCWCLKSAFVLVDVLEMGDSLSASPHLLYLKLGISDRRVRVHCQISPSRRILVAHLAQLGFADTSPSSTAPVGSLRRLCPIR